MLAFARRILAVRHSNNPQFAIIGKQIGRTIYSREELGLPGIDERRQIARSDFNSLDQIIEHKAEIVRKFVDLPLNIKRDYLKKFIYLSDFDHTDTANTIALIKQFDEAYHREVTRVENFGFATEISRSCHFLKDVDSLIQFYSDPHLKLVLNEQESHKIFLDLLYENKRYEDVYTWYQKIRRNLLLFDREPAKTLNCLLFAACYHLNTPDHFQYALDLWAEIDPSHQIGRSRYLLSALALKQNNPLKAAELISHLTSKYVTVKFLRIAIYTRSKHFEEVFAILEQSLKADRIMQLKQKPTIAKHLMSDLQAAIDKTGKRALIERLKEILKSLHKQNLLTDETLEQYLCAEFPMMLPKSTFHKINRKVYIQSDKKH